jgi:hypothetical protein
MSEAPISLRFLNYTPCAVQSVFMYIMFSSHRRVTVTVQDVQRTSDRTLYLLFITSTDEAIRNFEFSLLSSYSL